MNFINCMMFYKVILYHMFLFSLTVRSLEEIRKKSEENKGKVAKNGSYDCFRNFHASSLQRNSKRNTSGIQQGRH